LEIDEDKRVVEAVRAISTICAYPTTTQGSVA